MLSILPQLKQAYGRREAGRCSRYAAFWIPRFAATSLTHEISKVESPMKNNLMEVARVKRSLITTACSVHVDLADSKTKGSSYSIVGTSEIMYSNAR
jgi:hypothetical protein